MKASENRPEYPKDSHNVVSCSHHALVFRFKGEAGPRPSEFQDVFALPKIKGYVLAQSCMPSTPSRKFLIYSTVALSTAQKI